MNVTIPLTYLVAGQVLNAFVYDMKLQQFKDLNLILLVFFVIIYSIVNVIILIAQ